MVKQLETVEAVIETLYGRPADMARELERSHTAVWKYAKRNMLPGELYGPIQSKARFHGYQVADELFTTLMVHPRFITRTGV